MNKRICLIAFAVAAVFLLAGCVGASAGIQEPTPEPTFTPEPTPEPTPVPFADGFDLCGKHYETDTRSLDLRGYTAEDTEILLEVKPYLTALAHIELGDESSFPLTWEEIRELEEAFPGVRVHYSFSVYGKTFSLQDERLDLNHRTIEDQGELLRRIIPCMPELKLVDLDTCGIDNEHCAALRDEFSNVEIVWRIWFGSGGRYTARTDVERILASKPSAFGALTAENTHDLMYCTKVRYLDLGHNDALGAIDFCAYMPDLEVAIIAMTFKVKDLTPLKDCTKLEFLELQSNDITDVSPLAGLKNLEYLNLVQNFELEDITPLFGLRKLKKLYLGCTDPVPKVQVEAFKALMPKCAVNTISFDPHEGDWRYDFSKESHLSDRYELLKEQFGYNGDASPYSIPMNDPLYYPHDEG